jgi:Ni/Co efflux regulator RcnB
MRKYIHATVCFLALFAAAAVFGQERRDHTQFDDHDRQVTQDWYTQHQRHAPRGLREQDRLNSEEEARLQAGRPLDRDLWRHAYTAPSDLRRQLPPAPRHHSYMTIGGHVILVDTRDHSVRDVIHVHPH